MKLKAQLRLIIVWGGCLFVFWTTVAGQQAAQTPEPPFKIEVNVSRVLVPVVVRDAHGQTVGNLKKQDFKVFDRGKPQLISAFSVETRGIGEAGAQRPRAPPTGGNTPAASPEGRRFTVFLIDDLHLSAIDLGKVQRLGTKFLDPALAESDMAAVVSTSGANSGLTRDRVQLEEALLKLAAHSLYQRDAGGCPDVDYYKADLIENKRDRVALEAAIQQTLACANLDARMRNIAESMVRSAANFVLAAGDQGSRSTLAAIREYVRKMTALPGQRTLILVSPGFLTVSSEAMSEKAQIVDLAAQSEVTINTLDARQLYTTGGNASERGPGSTLAMQTGYDSQSRRESASLDEDVMAELADGSGGSFFHNNNDLEAGFKYLASAPEYVYLLEFSLDHVKADGSFHPLTVKVDRDGLRIQARRGYFAPKPEQNMLAKGKAGKDRPQQESPNEGKPVLAESPEVLAQPQTAAPSAVTAEVAGAKVGSESAHSGDAAASPAVPDSRMSSHGSNWTPPSLDTPFQPADPALSCNLPDILHRAGARAIQLYKDLQSFSAQEKIEYQTLDHKGYLKDAETGIYDYVVLFQQTARGTEVEESRRPKRGKHVPAIVSQDVGLPEMALMFLPEIQGDYAMKCEGSTEWRGQRAQVVGFAQRQNKASHTLSFRDQGGVVHTARLKGRAWIKADSSEVIHLESGLMEGIPNTNVRQWYLSADYAPVEFHTRNIQLLLPQRVDAYCDFDDHQSIVHHTFSDFMLFSVQTNQNVKLEKKPD